MVRKMHIVTIAALLLLWAAWGSAQGNRGYLKLAASAQAGNTVLPPGEYMVIHRISPTAGHYIEFSQIKEGGYGYLGMPIHRQEQVVAAVTCTLQPLTAKAAETLAHIDGSRIARLEIQGETVIYNLQ
jgi:hypothetical protein